jgi:hypothetical protein
MYMSYCRFEGTRQEMDSCINEVIDHINGDADYKVSDREIEEFRKMLRNFVEFLQDTEILDANGDIDGDVLDEVCKDMSYGHEEEL